MHVSALVGFSWKNSIHYYIETLPSRTCTYTSVRNNIFVHVLRTIVLGRRAGLAILSETLTRPIDEGAYLYGMDLRTVRLGVPLGTLLGALGRRTPGSACMRINESYPVRSLVALNRY